MLWKRSRRSDNVVGANAGGGPRMPGGRGGMGIGDLLIVVVVALFLGRAKTRTEHGHPRRVGHPHNAIFRSEDLAPV